MKIKKDREEQQKLLEEMQIYADKFGINSFKGNKKTAFYFIKKYEPLLNQDRKICLLLDPFKEEFNLPP
jgi:hypothetical protein